MNIYKVWFLLGIVVIALSVEGESVSKSDSSDVWHIWVGTMLHEGHHYGQEITEAQAKHYPDWDPRINQPPFSMGEAIRLGRSFFNRKWPGITLGVPESVSVERILKTQKWYYVVRFERKKGFAAREVQDTINIVVPFNKDIPQFTSLPIPEPPSPPATSGSLE